MKKLLSTMLIAVCVLLCSCGGMDAEKMQLQSPEVIDGYKAAEHKIYNSPAEENGLGGTKLYIDGVFENISDNPAIYALLNDGENKWVIRFASEPEIKLEALKGFEGQRVRVFGVYQGFSGKLKAPSAYCIKLTLTDTGESHHAMEFAEPVKPMFEAFEKTAIDSGKENNGQQEANQASGEEEAQSPVPAEENIVTETAKNVEEAKSEAPEEQAKPAEAVTIGQRNALKKAKNYLDVMAFSYSGMIKQLEYEGYSNAEAVYGADNCGADWNEQAAKKAESYLDVMSFSRSGLIEQLTYEGFTQAQAEYGATAVGY